jgi:formylglycine-generating enzyme required for sulfatase activity
LDAKIIAAMISLMGVIILALPNYLPPPDSTLDPIPDPTLNPTPYPTPYPIPDPTLNPTPYPTDPTLNPTPYPTPYPTLDPTLDLTLDPTPYPTLDPTPYPTLDPTPYPTPDPTPDPTMDYEEIFTNSIGMGFVLIPAGEFNMGSSEDEDNSVSDEEPVHCVKIEKAFYMGRCEVTQREWREVMGNNPSNFKGDNLPVERVSWNDVQDFIRKLNEKEVMDIYRLPSEAEWEYACRAGTTTIYSFGNDKSRLGDYVWYGENSGDKTQPVGLKSPNLWGLYDMHGNVLEWVQDKYHDSYDDAPINGDAWESGDSFDRVIRCGAWFDSTTKCRSANRYKRDADEYRYNLGFRLLKET